MKHKAGFLIISNSSSSMPLELIFTFGLALIVLTIGLFLLWPAAVEYGLEDRLDHRNQHTDEIPLIGGVCLLLGE